MKLLSLLLLVSSLWSSTRWSPERALRELLGPLMPQYVVVPFTHGSGVWSASYVQGCVGNGTTAASCALSSNIASGNLLVVVSKGGGDSGGSSPTITSSSGVSCSWFVGIPGFANTNFTTIEYYCVVPSTGAETVQVAWTGTVFSDITVSEYSSSTGWQSSPLDQTVTAESITNSTPCASGTSPTMTNANDLIVANCESWFNIQTWGAVSGYTNRAASSRNTSGWYDKIATTAATQSWSKAITADQWTAFLAGYKGN